MPLTLLLGVATVQMNRPPVNSLNLEFLTDINITLEKLHNDKSCRGLILTSVSVLLCVHVFFSQNISFLFYSICCYILSALLIPNDWKLFVFSFALFCKKISSLFIYCNGEMFFTSVVYLLP